MSRACAQSRMAVHSAPELQHQRELAGRHAVVAEGGVEAVARDHDAEAVRPDQAHAVRTRGVAHLFLQRAPLLADLAEAGRQDDRGAHPGFAALTDDGGNTRRRRGDHRQVDRRADGAQRGIAAQALHGLVLGIDRIEAAGVAVLPQVAQHDLADRLRPLGGAEHGDRLRGEQAVEVVGAHIKDGEG